MTTMLIYSCMNDESEKGLTLIGENPGTDQLSNSSTSTSGFNN